MAKTFAEKQAVVYALSAALKAAGLLETAHTHPTHRVCPACNKPSPATVSLLEKEMVTCASPQCRYKFEAPARRPMRAIMWRPYPETVKAPDGEHEITIPAGLYPEWREAAMEPGTEINPFTGRPMLAAKAEYAAAYQAIRDKFLPELLG